MYSLADIVPDADVDPGTNLLISGPPMTDKRGIALRILANGSERGDGAVVVTTKDGADRILSEYDGIVDVTDAPFGVVDCVSKQRGATEGPKDSRVKYASSPVDMTGIGIELSAFLEEFYQQRGVERNRVLLYSLSTMLMYSELQTVFRFLHVFTGRIQSTDALGLYVIDSTTHDQQTTSTLKQLFDGVLEVEADDANGPEVTLRGL